MGTRSDTIVDAGAAMPGLYRRSAGDLAYGGRDTNGEHKPRVNESAKRKRGRISLGRYPDSTSREWDTGNDHNSDENESYRMKLELAKIGLGSHPEPPSPVSKAKKTTAGQAAKLHLKPRPGKLRSRSSVHHTISKDHTKGDDSRKSDLLAAFGQRLKTFHRHELRTRQKGLPSKPSVEVHRTDMTLPESTEVFDHTLAYADGEWYD